MQGRPPPAPEMVISGVRGLSLYPVLLTGFLGSSASSQSFPQLGLNGESWRFLPGLIQLPAPPMPLSSRVSRDPQNHHLPVGLARATCHWLLARSAPVSLPAEAGGCCELAKLSSHSLSARHHPAVLREVVFSFSSYRSGF